jgi:O-antigen/teichoic acid export membrane protein
VTSSEQSRPTVDDHVARLFGRDSLYMVLWAVQLVCAAGMTPVITRMLGPAEFGVVASTNALMQVLFVVGGFGLQAAIQRQYERPGGHHDARRLLTLSIALAGVVTAVAYATAAMWTRTLGLTGELLAVHLTILWAGLSAVTAASLGLLRSQDRLLAFVTVSLIQSVVAEGASVWLIGLHRPTGTNFVLGQLLAQLLATVLALLLAPPGILRGRHKALVTGALAFALPLVPAMLGTFVLAVADRLIVQSTMGADAVARYQVAYNIASLPLLLLSLLSSAWMPRFFALHDGPERAAVLAESRDLLYRLLVPLLVGFSVGAALILRVWAPASYRPETLSLVTVLVVVTAVPFAAYLATSRALTAKGATGTIAVATLIAAAANVGLNIALIPAFGLTGSAGATLISYALLQSLLQLKARRVAPTVAPSRTLRLQLAAAAAVALASAAVPITGVALWVRIAVVLLTTVWFFRLLIGANRRAAAGRPEERAAESALAAADEPVRLRGNGGAARACG